MQWDLVLFAKLLRGENRQSVYRNLRNIGFSPELLPLTQQSAWKWIERQVIEDRGVPTEAMFRAKYAGIHFPPTADFAESVRDDSIREVVAQLQRRKLATLGIETAEKLALLSESDPEQIPDLLANSQKLAIGSVPLPGVIEVGAEPDLDMAEYAKFRSAKGSGLPFPIPALVPGGMGLNPAGIYIFYGPPGSKKTFLLFWLALWYRSIGYRVLLMSQEWLWDRARWRLYCLAGGFDWNEIQHGRIGDPEVIRIIRELNHANPIYYQNPIAAEDCRPSIEATVGKIEPDIVLDDAPYLRTVKTGSRGEVMTIRGSTQAAGEFMGFSKGISTAFGIPYMFTWQPNDDGLLYGSRTGGQDAEMVLYLDSTTEITTLRPKKQRDGAPVEAVSIYTDLNDTSNFGQLTGQSITRSSVASPKKPKISLNRNARPEAST